VEKSGLIMLDKLPVLYFVRAYFRGRPGYNYATVGNTIVEYYDNRDIEQFDRIARTKLKCCQHTFVVYVDDNTIECYETGNVSNSYRFNSGISSHVISMVRKDIAAIEKLKEEERRKEAMRQPKKKRDPNFKLVYDNGDTVHDGDLFYIKLPSKEVLEEDEYFENSYPADILEGDYIHIFDGGLMANPGVGNVFTTEAIDGIVYLKSDEGYLFCPNTEEKGISLNSSLPVEAERLQLHYAGNNAFRLTMWNGDIFARCEWVKVYVGIVSFDDRWGEPIELQLIPKNSVVFREETIMI
jgi:hypothetical protein